jgi:hypothetical protein
MLNSMKRDHLEKSVIAKLVKKFPTFYGTQIHIPEQYLRSTLILYVYPFRSVMCA